jgi:hypothetical protein
VLQSLQIAAWVALFALAGPACSQQATPSLPLTADNAASPSAPEPQAAPAQLASAAPQPPEQSAPGSIHGVIVDREGTVCEGAHIALSQPSSTPLSLRATTSGASGRFDFTGVPVGAFTLTVTAKGFATQVVTGILRSGESYEAQPIAMLVTTAQSEVRVTASQQEIAQAQFHEEEKQRVLGVIPNFYVAYAPSAPPLTSKQKFHLAAVSMIDPITLLSTGFFAGIEQAQDSFSGYGEGAEGYGKRFAANYADNVIGTMIGAAMLPSLLKQDPRYFYKGTGSKRSRIGYAIAMSVVCRGDNGHWQPNYSGLTASVASGGISNLYYPAANRNGVTLTFENTSIGIAEYAAQNLFQEFFLRRLTPKLVHYNSPQP